MRYTARLAARADLRWFGSSTNNSTLMGIGQTQIANMDRLPFIIFIASHNRCFLPAEIALFTEQTREPIQAYPSLYPDNTGS